MMVHSVFFRLKHQRNSDAEKIFLAKGAALAELPGVQQFSILEETSPKNDFTFGFFMQFCDQAAYEAYNNHPDHVKFVQEVWLEEVADFQEIDYVPYTA